MAGSSCYPLKPTKMAMPKDDSRDPQFHLNILKKNDQQGTKRPK
jgi:hypothetical protein